MQLSALVLINLINTVTHGGFREGVNVGFMIGNFCKKDMQDICDVSMNGRVCF